MREIKFRAKTIDTGAWVFGSLVKQPTGEFIGSETYIQSNTCKWDKWIVAPETVGQYTGLKNSVGTEIYEGDILGGYPHGTAKVCWSDEWGCWETVSIDSEPVETEVNGAIFTTNSNGLLANDLIDCSPEWKVIGNVFDNKELLKVELQ